MALPALAVLAWTAAQWGMAETMARAASERIDQWQLKGVRPGLAPWMAVRTNLQRAGALSPDDPAVPEALGLLHLFRARQPEFADIAREHFAHALALRPTSAYTWANLAAARQAFGEPYEFALLTGWRLGPFEPTVQRAVLEVGLADFDAAPAAVQAAVREVLPSAMRRNPLETLAIADRLGRPELACPFGLGDARLAQTRWVEACGMAR